MALDKEQRERVIAEAARLGVDEAKLLEAAEAESETGSEGEGDASSSSAKPAAGATVPPLYMYHLPFVTVNEVRERWLGLDKVTNGEEYAAVWAAKQLAGGGGSGEPK